MKKISDTIEYYAIQAERKWKDLPAKRQRLLTKLLFAGYAVLSVLMIISICISTGYKNNIMFASPIGTISDQRVLKKVSKEKDSGVEIKKKNYERSK